MRATLLAVVAAAGLGLAGVSGVSAAPINGAAIGHARFADAFAVAAQPLYLSVAGVCAAAAVIAWLALPMRAPAGAVAAQAG